MIRARATVAAVCLTLPLTLAHADTAPEQPDISWAYGTIVDSVTVSGNRNTKGYVILREMQTQPGAVLNQKDFERDIRFITDLSPIQTAIARIDSAGAGHVIIRLTVTERSAILVGSILPLVKYNFETGLNYGVRWQEANFRGRLENLTFVYFRNERDDNDVSFGWGAPWIGWNHISVGVGTRYFERGRVPDQRGVLESFGVQGFLALPLTESRARFAQIVGSLNYNRERLGSKGNPTENEITLSPAMSFRYDSRDSRVRPNRGSTVFVAQRVSYPLVSERRPYYLFRNEIRTFVGVGPKNVIAFLSNLTYQFGDFPEFNLFGMGGPGSLRGYPSRRFVGWHRWFGTVEWRHTLIPTHVFSLPVIKTFDIGLGLTMFMDSGIVWEGAYNFSLDRLHGTTGLGIRLYNPIRDVLRMDVGFTADGDVRFSFASGVRF
ncbi:MAG: BamA/TamA family outer membrane protein [bacterium]|nr:BamA/TamA family outer membrane protein [bacterium]